jgi:zinc transporter ZupT
MSDQNQNGRGPIWIWAIIPIVLLVGLVWAVAALDPTQTLRGNAPPIETLVFQRVALDDYGITATVLNDGPDEVTIAQVQVDEAYWQFSQEPAGALGHLAQARISIPYPWVEGEVHEVRLISATGVTFDHEIAVATRTPTPDRQFLKIFALIGLYVGVIPVCLGLLWFPMVGRLGRSGLDFVLALTVGLLVFLLIDTVDDGLEIAGEIAASYQGTVLFLGTAALAYLVIEMLGSTLRRSRKGAHDGWVTALTVAFGIGLHNLGEGLAIGAAFALGEASLGTLLIVGFMLHNTTEGLAIVAPLTGSSTPIRNLVALGLLAGVPTILGTWIGGFTYSPMWALVFLAVGAGAIAQVSVQILKGTAAGRALPELLTTMPVISGLVVGLGVMYATGMLIG